MEIFENEYSLECEIFLRFCEYSLQNEYFEANIRQYENNVKRIFPLKRIFASVFFASNQIFVYEYVRKF